MEQTPLKTHYVTGEEFDIFHADLKHLLCPHCRRRGCLILHGYLYGYGEDDDWARRGHRVFCSGRNRKTGCGRTFSLLKSWAIKHFMISARVLSVILDFLCRGLCPSKIHDRLQDRISRTGVYRVCQRFHQNHPLIRTLLARVKDPPRLPDTKDPDIS